VCATLKALVCMKKCVSNRFKEEKEGQTQFVATSYSNLCWLFWRSNGETLSDQVSIFIKDSSLIFFQSGRYDCLLEVCRNITSFVKRCCLQKVSVTVSIVLKIQRWNLLQFLWIFYWSFITHNTLFWTVGFEIGALVCFKKIREQSQFFW